MQKPPWRNIKTAGSLFCLKIHGWRAKPSFEAHSTCELWLCYPALLICPVFCVLFHGFSSKRETGLWDCLPSIQESSTKSLWCPFTDTLQLYHYRHAIVFILLCPQRPVSSSRELRWDWPAKKSGYQWKYNVFSRTAPRSPRMVLLQSLLWLWYLFCLTERDLPTGRRVLCETFSDFFSTNTEP